MELTIQTGLQGPPSKVGQDDDKVVKLPVASVVDEASEASTVKSERSKDERSSEGQTAQKCDAEKVQSYLWKYHLPLGLLCGVLFGYAWPLPGRELGNVELFLDMGMSSVDVFIIFLISGLKLKTDDIKKAVSAWQSLSYGLLSILIITPCFAFAFVQLEPALSVSEFAWGLAIFALMPTTLSSGVILTRDAEGNVALALLLTVASNLLAVALIPFSVALVFSSAGDLDISIDPFPMIIKLLLSILLPLIIGKVLRDTIPAVVEFTANWGKTLKLTSSFCLVMVPWMKVSKAADDMSEINGVSMIVLVMLGIGLHLFYLAMNFLAASGLRFGLAEKKAVVIMCSQKTLPVAVAVIDFLPDDDDSGLGEPGIMTIACIVAHFVQIVIDAIIASYWADYHDKKEKDTDTLTTESSSGVVVPAPTMEPVATVPASVRTQNSTQDTLAKDIGRE